METQTQNNKYYLNKGNIDKSFFDEYIKDHVQKNLHNKCNNILNNYEFIEYYSIGLKSNRVACYSELWFLDINLKDNKLLPVYIENINTSSCYSLCRCNQTEGSDNDDEDEDDYKTLEEILEMCPVSIIPQINKILHNEI